MNGEIFAFIVYFVAIVGVGIYFFFKEKGDATQANFFLGGRQMGPWVAAMSAQASDMSAWLLMGLPGSILAFGFGQMWIGIGLALGTAANWIFVAKRLRKFSSAAGDAITVPQYLGNRFLSKSNADVYKRQPLCDTGILRIRIRLQRHLMACIWILGKSLGSQRKSLITNVWIRLRRKVFQLRKYNRISYSKKVVST